MTQVRTNASLILVKRPEPRLNGKRMIEAMQRAGYDTDVRLAEKVGVRQDQIRRWKLGEHTPGSQNLMKLARELGVSTEYLLDLETEEDLRVSTIRRVELLWGDEAAKELRRRSVRLEPHVVVPLFRIAAGQGRAAIRTGETVEIPPSVADKVRGDLREHYGLRIEGESMSGDDLHDGDVVLIRSTEVYSRDAICVVYLQSRDEATLKRVRRRGETMYLTPSNPEFQEMQVSAADVKIQGRLVAPIHRKSQT